MTVEVLDYRIKQLANITGLCIFDDESFDEALFDLIRRYDNQRKNISYLQSELTNNGIKTKLN